MKVNVLRSLSIFLISFLAACAPQTWDRIEEESLGLRAGASYMLLLTATDVRSTSFCPIARVNDSENLLKECSITAIQTNTFTSSSGFIFYSRPIRFLIRGEIIVNSLQDEEKRHKMLRSKAFPGHFYVMFEASPGKHMPTTFLAGSEVAYSGPIPIYSVEPEKITFLGKFGPTDAPFRSGQFPIEAIKEDLSSMGATQWVRSLIDNQPETVVGTCRDDQSFWDNILVKCGYEITDRKYGGYRYGG